MEKFMLIIREDLKRIGAADDEERLSNMPERMSGSSPCDSGNYIIGEPLPWGRYVARMKCCRMGLH